MVNHRTLLAVRKAIVEYLELVDLLNTRLTNERGAYSAMVRGKWFVEEMRVRVAARNLVTTLQHLMAKSKGPRKGAGNDNV